MGAAGIDFPTWTTSPLPTLFRHLIIPHIELRELARLPVGSRDSSAGGFQSKCAA